MTPEHSGSNATWRAGISLTRGPSRFSRCPDSAETLGQLRVGSEHLHRVMPEELQVPIEHPYRRNKSDARPKQGVAPEPAVTSPQGTIQHEWNSEQQRHA